MAFDPSAYAAVAVAQGERPGLTVALTATPSFDTVAFAASELARGVKPALTINVGGGSSGGGAGVSYTQNFTGDVTGSSYIGGGNVSTGLTLASTGVAAGSYNNASITVDAKGRITAASTGPSTAIWPAARTFSYTGDATGSLAADGSANVSAALTLATVNANVGTFGSSALIPVITVDAKGRITAASTVAVSGGGGGVTSVTGSAPIVSSGGTTPAISINNFTASAAGAVPASGGGTTNYLRADGSWSPISGGSGGTVTSVSVTTANGISGTVANASSTPSITLNLGAITPTSVAATGAVTGSNLSGTNTGDQTSVTGNAGTATKLATARTINGVSFDGTANITINTGAAITDLEQGINFTAAGDAYIPARVAMTIAQGNAPIGTGTITYAASTSAAPSTFNTVTLPATLQAGAWLKVSAASVSGFVAIDLYRTA